MQGTMLEDEYSTIDANNLAVGECFLQLCECFPVFFCLLIGGHQHRSIDDEEVGMGSRKSVAFFVKTRVGERKRKECIGGALKSA